jgi:hypothetical protein
MLGILQRKRFLILPVINKWIADSQQLSLLIFIFYGLLAAALLAPIASITNIPNLGDFLTNLAALIQAKIALSSGQFPLRFMPLEHWGWHYPFFQFYSTSTFTFAGLIYEWLTPDNPLLAYKVTIWCGLVLGAVYLQRVAFWFVQSRPAAVLAGVIYLCAPYYVIIINMLGSINEILALGILPVVLYYTLVRFHSPNDNMGLAKLAVAWYCLATTHIVTFVYASFFIGMLLLLVTYKNPRHWRNLIAVGIAFFLGCLLAMWYLAPIAMFETFFKVSTTYNDPSHLSLYHPFLSQLLFSSAALTPGFKSNAMMTIHPAVGWPILFSVGLCLYASLTKLSSGSRRADYWLPALLIIFFIAFFLVWSPFTVWQWLPKQLLIAQYSWRLLSQVIWIGALLSAWALCWLFKNKLDWRHIIFGTILILLSANAWFPVSENANASLADFIKQPHLLYNDDSYILNFEKYTNFVDKIDNTLIEPTKELKTNTEYYIPKPLLKLAVNPAIEIRANIPVSLNDKNFHLAVYVNNVLADKKDLTTGALDWNINLLTAKKLYPNSAPLILKFLLLNKNENIINETLPIDRVILTGYIDPAETLNITQVQSYCTQKKSISVCNVPVSKGINFIELPSLYYPKLLRVSLNGKPIAYQSIMVEGELLTGIVPEQGAMNRIHIEFQGLNWANWASWLAWILISFILIHHIVMFFKQAVFKRSLKLTKIN